MEQTTFASHFDARTSTLELSGELDEAAWPRIIEEVDRAFRRTACLLTVDLTHGAQVPAHTLGRLVHLCNRCYPGTVVRTPVRRRDQVRAIA
jgi:ABC-type transporter Mla MlaB component